MPSRKGGPSDAPALSYRFEDYTTDIIPPAFRGQDADLHKQMLWMVEMENGSYWAWFREHGWATDTHPFGWFMPGFGFHTLILTTEGSATWSDPDSALVCPDIELVIATLRKNDQLHGFRHVYEDEDDTGMEYAGQDVALYWRSPDGREYLIEGLRVEPEERLDIWAYTGLRRHLEWQERKAKAQAATASLDAK